MIYPKASCSLLSYQGELFENVYWVGCSGSKSNNKLLGKDGEVLAENGTLIKATVDAVMAYRCKSVNSAFIKKIDGKNFEVFFRTKTENGRQFIHNIYSFKWNKTINAPVWVRHIPSVSFSDPSVIDTKVRSPWRYSKLVFDNDPRKAFKFAYKKHRMSRGHLAPAGDFLLAAERWATFQLSNVIPQPETHNNGEWKAIEDYVRTKFDKNMIKYVETGPIFNDKPEKLEGIVPVPKGIYKKVIGRDNDEVLYEVQSFFS